MGGDTAVARTVSIALVLTTIASLVLLIVYATSDRKTDPVVQQRCEDEAADSSDVAEFVCPNWKTRKALMVMSGVMFMVWLVITVDLVCESDRSSAKTEVLAVACVCGGLTVVLGTVGAFLPVGDRACPFETAAECRLDCEDRIGGATVYREDLDQPCWVECRHLCEPVFNVSDRVSVHTETGWHEGVVVNTTYGVNISVTLNSVFAPTGETIEYTNYVGRLPFVDVYRPSDPSRRESGTCAPAPPPRSWELLRPKAKLQPFGSISCSERASETVWYEGVWWGPTQWTLSFGDVDCHDTCALYNAECTETDWPTHRAAMEAIANVSGVSCGDNLVDGGNADGAPSMNTSGFCAFPALQHPSCSYRPASGALAQRFCPCARVSSLPSALMGYLRIGIPITLSIGLILFAVNATGSDDRIFANMSLVLIALGLWAGQAGAAAHYWMTDNPFPWESQNFVSVWLISNVVAHGTLSDLLRWMYDNPVQNRVAWFSSCFMCNAVFLALNWVVPYTCYFLVNIMGAYPLRGAMIFVGGYGFAGVLVAWNRTFFQLTLTECFVSAAVFCLWLPYAPAGIVTWVLLRDVILPRSPLSLHATWY